MNNQIIRKGIKAIFYASVIASTSLAYAQNGVIVDKSNTDDTSQNVGNDSTIVGPGNTTTGQSNMTIVGSQNQATKYGATILGASNIVESTNSVAIGSTNYISGSGRGFTLGNMNMIEGTTESSSVYLFGMGLSNNGFSDCVAFGSSQITPGAGCTANNQLNVSGMTIGSLAEGVLDSDAVNLGQVKSMISPLSTGLTNVQSAFVQGFNTLQGQMSLNNANLQNQINALASATPPNPPTTPTTPTAPSNQAQVDQNTNDLAVHTGQISNLTNQTNSNTNALNTQAGQISSLSQQTSANTSAIAKNTADIQVHTEQIAKNSAELAVHTEQIKSVTEQTSTNTVAIAKNTGDIALQGSQISTLSETQAKMMDFDQMIANQTTSNTQAIKGLDNRVGSLENRVTTLEGKAKSYAYSAAALAMSANINFNPFLDRQIGLGVASVGGRSAISAGLAVRTNNGMASVKISKGSQMPLGASASMAIGF